MYPEQLNKRVQKLLDFFGQYNATKSVLEQSEHKKMYDFLRGSGIGLIEKAAMIALVCIPLSALFLFVCASFFKSFITVALGGLIVSAISFTLLLLFYSLYHNSKSNAFFKKHFSQSETTYIKQSVFPKLFVLSTHEVGKDKKDARVQFFQYVLENFTPEDQQHIYEASKTLGEQQNNFFWEHALKVLNEDKSWSEIEDVFLNKEYNSQPPSVFVEQQRADLEYSNADNGSNINPVKLDSDAK